MLPVLLATLVMTGCSLGQQPVPSAATTSPTSDPVSSALTSPTTSLVAVGDVATALAKLPVRPLDAAPRYNRQQQFLPHGWEDLDGNGCDARRDAIARQAVRDIVRKGTADCILTATVSDPYSDADISSIRAQADHVVALKDAWLTGATAMTLTMRERLANDPLNLIMVAGSLNASKGDKAADEWLPPTEGFHCASVAQQIAVKTRYGLWVTQGEHDKMVSVLAACPGQQPPTETAKVVVPHTAPPSTQAHSVPRAPGTTPSTQVHSVPRAPGTTSRPAPPSPAPAPAPATSCHPSYDPCVPDSPSDLNCPDIGMKVRVVGPDKYRLDANKDGWGCESYG
jgi:hypothetical protein